MSKIQRDGATKSNPGPARTQGQLHDEIGNVKVNGCNTIYRYRDRGYESYDSALYECRTPIRIQQS